MNVALFLSRLGIEVTLLESGADILEGASQVCLINHADGFEYYKDGHRRTGEFCIDGSLAKGLIYPLQTFRTSASNETTPIRFFVSEGSVESNELTVDRFMENVGYMRRYFTAQFDSIRTAYGWTEEDAERRFLRRPATFARRLESSEFPDVLGAAAACAGSSFGINMPRYYALLKAAMREAGIECNGKSAPEAIERQGSLYRVHAGGHTYSASHVLLTCGHHIPVVAAGIRHASLVPPPAGSYFLNAMTFLRLPATRDPERLTRARRINFTIQQDHGCMFACIVPPEEHEDGLAAVYFPSAQGSQLRRHRFDPDQPMSPPADWDDLMKCGLPSDDPHVRRTIEQACRLYPVLTDYAEVSHTVCRAVFNVATSDNDHGEDRRVREISGVAHSVTDDGRVSSWTAPKWTNAELVALLAADYVSTALGHGSLPKGGRSRLGPTGLDVAAVSQSFSFSAEQIDPSDAFRYASREGLPKRAAS